ncbi:transcription termination factor NusA [bacterium DOLZORAL124_38_8]|nr:MAG: transcription termination factor NusA [bacterium DOLZORAL124_38_8]
MQSQLQAAINQICAEKNIEQSVVVQAIESAIALAYKKDFGRPTQNIKVHMGDSIADIRIFEIRTVVEKVVDFDTEISLKEAQLIRPDVEVGGTVYVPVELHENFGRIAAQTAKQVLTQQIQEAERSMLHEKFTNKVGELLTARVQKVDRDSVLVEIEGVTTLLYNKQQIRGEKYFTGQRIKVYLESVGQSSKGPQLKITRSSKRFIEALFEAEIPEMRQELVYIARIAREAGVRCKIAVASDEQGVDPVGAFVGQRGSRIKAVMEEVGEERLDIIQFSEDPKKFLLAALAPAKISKVEFYKGEKGEDRVKIFVREEERAMAIGRKGQNVRIAGQLVGMQIDVLTFDGPEEEDESIVKAPEPKQKKEKREVNEKVTIDQLDGVNPEVVATLMEIGLSQIKQFEGLKADELAEIGISVEEAQTVVDAVAKYLKQL